MIFQPLPGSSWHTVYKTSHHMNLCLVYCEVCSCCAHTKTPHGFPDSQKDIISKANDSRKWIGITKGPNCGKRFPQFAALEVFGFRFLILYHLPIGSSPKNWKQSKKAARTHNLQIWELHAQNELPSRQVSRTFTTHQEHISTSQRVTDKRWEFLLVSYHLFVKD